MAREQERATGERQADGKRPSTDRGRPGAFWVQATAVLVLLFGVGVFLAIRASSRPLPAPERASRRNILIVGVDNASAGPVRADSLMVLSIERGKNTGVLLWIPRITSGEIPGRRGLHPLEEARRTGGPKLAAAAVETLLDIKIDKYAQITYPGLLKAADLLEGIQVEVRPGWKEVINGDRALGLVRFPDERSADPEVFRLQQAVLVGMAQRVQSGAGLRRLGELKTIVAQNVITDLKAEELTAILTFLGRSEDRLPREILPGQLQAVVVDGRSQLRWVPDKERVNEMLKKRLGAAK